MPDAPAAVVTLLVSDVALVHGFFVWPKLLPTAYLLAVAAIVLSPRWRAWSRRALVAIVVGALAALALLAHGGSVFGLVPLAAIALVRARPSPRWLMSGAATAFLLLLPWTLYQRLVDPPGNRLLKWHLGGAVAVDDRGLGETLRDGYSGIGAETAARYKLDNLTTMLGTQDSWWHPVSGVARALDGRLAEAGALVRDDRFLYLVPSAGLLVLAPLAGLLVALVRRRRAGGPLVPAKRHPEWTLGCYSLAVVVVGAVVWAFLMFGPGTTVIHQGTLLLPLLLILGLLMMALALSPPAGLVVAGLNVVTVAMLYGPWDNGLPFSRAEAAVALAGIVTYGFAAWTAPIHGSAGRAPRDVTPRDPDSTSRSADASH